MLTTAQLKRLKKINVSKDVEKTKERIKTDFNAATNTTKKAIVELSGQARNAFYRAYETGSANGRIILSMAEVLKVSPFYYTGDIDDRAELADADVIKFLQDIGYSNLAEELAAEEAPQKPAPKPKRKYSRKQKPESAPEPDAVLEPATAPEPEAASEPVQPAPAAQPAVEKKAPDPVIAEDSVEIKITLPENSAVHDAVAALSEEEIISLLKALLIKEKAGGAPAKMAEIIKRCLLI